MSTGNFVHRLRAAYADKLHRLQLDVVRGALSHEDYLRQCGQFQGVEWALTELNDLASTYNGDSEDLDDDELTQVHGV